MLRPTLHAVLTGCRDQARPVRGPERVRRQHVLDVHDQQLLVLLLVVQTQFDEVEQVGWHRRDRREHRVVDVLAVVGDLGDAGTRQQPTLGTWMPRADCFVVRVEQVPEVGVERVVARLRAGQDEGLEEPRRVRSVPLGRAHVRHRLDRLVLGGQWRGKGVGQRAYFGVTLGERRAAVSIITRVRRDDP